MDLLLDLDDELIARLECKAKLNNRTLEDQLRHIITTASYRAVRPPSMTNSAPVTKRDSSDNR
jgi:plasmid stability protein